MKPILKVGSVVFALSVMAFLSCRKNVLLPTAKETEAQTTTTSAGNSKLRIQSTTAYDALINKQVQFILDCRKGKAIRLANQANAVINPYFANIAASGLLEQGTANVGAVKDWILWYLSHLNGNTVPGSSPSVPEVPGSIYDYYADGLAGHPDSSYHNYDSVDSYAATFLSLVRKLAAKDPSQISWIAGYSTKINLVGSALQSCIDNSSYTVPLVNPDGGGAPSPENNNGFTVNKLNYNAKYTEDNAEVMRGLNDMVWLQNNVITVAMQHHTAPLRLI